jgi:hypothetical protein
VCRQLLCETLMLSAVGGLLDSLSPQHGRKHRETKLFRWNESEPLVLALVLQQYPRPLDLSYMNRNWQIVVGRKVLAAQYVDDRIGVSRLTCRTDIDSIGMCSLERGILTG